jgi:hypothetical protein
MRLAYFDCIAGISGDSALGALVDAGADADQLRTHLATLPLEPFELEFQEVDEHGVRAVRAGVRGSAIAGVIRTYASVRALLDAAQLPPKLEEYFLSVQPGYEDDPAQAVYNHAWVLGDDKAISVDQQAQVDQVTELIPVQTNAP